MCNMDCFNCIHSDCINDRGATPEEIKNINKSSKECKKYKTTKKQRAAIKRYADKNKDKRKTYNRAYYLTHRESILAKQKMLTQEQKIEKAIREKEYRLRKKAEREAQLCEA